LNSKLINYALVATLWLLVNGANAQTQDTITYYSNGDLRSKGTVNENGQKTGKWYSYHPDNKLYSIRDYLNDTIVGDCFYYNNGEVYRVDSYLNGKVIKYQGYSNGKLFKVFDYHNKRDTLYHYEGGIYAVTHWTDEFNVETVFDKTGKIESIIQYSVDSIVLYKDTLYRNGKIKEVGTKERWVKHGMSVTYNKNSIDKIELYEYDNMINVLYARRQRDKGKKRNKSQPKINK